MVGDTVSHGNVSHNNKSTSSNLVKVKKFKIRKYKIYHIIILFTGKPWPDSLALAFKECKPKPP